VCDILLMGSYILGSIEQPTSIHQHVQTISSNIPLLPARSVVTDSRYDCHLQESLDAGSLVTCTLDRTRLLWLLSPRTPPLRPPCSACTESGHTKDWNLDCISYSRLPVPRHSTVQCTRRRRTCITPVLPHLPQVTLQSALRQH
jgi:hypothetical protein